MTPEHIARRSRRALDVPVTRVTPESIETDGPRTTATLGERSPVAAASGDAPPPTRLAERLDAGHFVLSVEIDPPRSIRIERTIEAARLLRDAGVDVVNVSDSAMARVRMSALSVAFGIQHDLDLECLVHFTRSKLIFLESELLALTRSASATSSP
jgi:homocysteine S-methyltransferase